MKNGDPCPTFTPSPLPFVLLNKDVSGDFIYFLLVIHCPFCHQRFEPTWDSKIASCKHSYHSWCAFTEFSKSWKCLLKDCQKEIHSNWWVLSWIKKPCSEEKGTLEVDWATRPNCALEALQGEFCIWAFFFMGFP